MKRGTEGGRGDSFSRLDFPNISSLHLPSTRHPREISPSIVPAVFHSYATIAPLLARLAVTNALTLPLFTVTLQRDTVAIGGNVGTLSIGELPSGIKNESLTWVPVRLYTKAQGGLPPPPDSPNEVRYISSAYDHNLTVNSTAIPYDMGNIH
jgi:phytepsin